MAGFQWLSYIKFWSPTLTIKLALQKNVEMYLVFLWRAYLLELAILRDVWHRSRSWWFMVAKKRPVSLTPAYRKAGKLSFHEFSLQHISNRNKSTGDNGDNKWICVESICSLSTPWESSHSEFQWGRLRLWCVIIYTLYIGVIIFASLSYSACNQLAYK